MNEPYQIVGNHSRTKRWRRLGQAAFPHKGDGGCEKRTQCPVKNPNRADAPDADKSLVHLDEKSW